MYISKAVRIFYGVGEEKKKKTTVGHAPADESLNSVNLFSVLWGERDHVAM